MHKSNRKQLGWEGQTTWEVSPSISTAPPSKVFYASLRFLPKLENVMKEMKEAKPSISFLFSETSLESKYLPISNK